MLISFFLMTTISTFQTLAGQCSPRFHAEARSISGTVKWTIDQFAGANLEWFNTCYTAPYKRQNCPQYCASTWDPACVPVQLISFLFPVAVRFYIVSLDLRIDNRKMSYSPGEGDSHTFGPDGDDRRNF